MPAIAHAAGPTLGDVFKNTGITATGYVDASYTYLSGTGTFTGGGFNRVYDREQNSFNLHAVDIALGYQPSDGFGAFVQLDLGADADVTAAAGTDAADQVDIQEAYVQYAKGPVTVIGGKFATLAGFEVIEAPANLNFSRSILYGYAIPFTHTGLRASVAVGEIAKVHVGVNNGWDVFKTSATAPSDGKTLEAGVALTPIKPLAVNVAGYYGDALVAGYGAPRYVLDVVATYSITDNLSVALNADLGNQEDASGVGMDADWSGIAAYLNWKFADQWRVAFRAEQFDDQDGYRTGVNAATGGHKWTEGTVTVAFLPTANAEIRVEGRYDKSDFATAFTQTDGTQDDNQYSFAVQGIYKF
jgi:hypothetical protein